MNTETTIPYSSLRGIELHQASQTLTSVTRMPLEAYQKRDTSFCLTSTLLVALPDGSVSTGTSNTLPVDVTF